MFFFIRGKAVSKHKQLATTPWFISAPRVLVWCINFSVCNLPAAFNGTNFHYICSMVQRALSIAKGGQLHTESRGGKAQFLEELDNREWFLVLQQTNYFDKASFIFMTYYWLFSIRKYSRCPFPKNYILIFLPFSL